MRANQKFGNDAETTNEEAVNIRGLSKKFVEFVYKNKSTRAAALKFLHVKDLFKPDKIWQF